MATDTFRSMMAEFEAEMQAAEAPQMMDAEKWDKDAMPLLIGTLMEYKHIVMKTGDEFDQVVVDVPEVGLIRFSMTMGLRRQWEDLLPVVGDVIGVKFCGSVATKTGGTFNQFILRVMPAVDKSTETDPFEDQ